MLQILVRPTWLDICCADKHLGLIKHLVQTVKEQVHCTRLMKKLLIEYLVYWINKLPTNNGIERWDCVIALEAAVWVCPSE